MKGKRKEVYFMKRFTKLFSFILTVVLTVSIFPAATANAAEKKYKLSLTGEYDLDSWTKANYQYEKTLKSVKLEKVAGKNQWNLTMYADTSVDLPVNVSSTTYKVEITTKSEYLYGSYRKEQDVISIDAEDEGQKKTLTNKVLTCKSYNKSGKCLSTLKIVVKILPNNEKLKRSVPATGEELYKLGYDRDRYSDFAWDYVIKKFPEYLLPTYNDLYQDSAERLSEEMKQVVFAAKGEVFVELEPGQRLPDGYEVSKEDCDAVQKILDSLELEQYETDWEKVFAIQKWVKANIEYEEQVNPSVLGILKRKNGDCDCLANLMKTACRLLGIPCYIVVGSMYTRNDHAWNIVLVDGLWCTMDLTDRPGFGVIDCRDFMGEPSIAAVEQVKQVLGGEAHLFDDDIIWKEYEERWGEDTAD